jgi:hypothetical protein
VHRPSVDAPSRPRSCWQQHVGGCDGPTGPGRGERGRRDRRWIGRCCRWQHHGRQRPSLATSPSTVVGHPGGMLLPAASRPGTQLYPTATACLPATRALFGRALERASRTAHRPLRVSRRLAASTNGRRDPAQPNLSAAGRPVGCGGRPQPQSCVQCLAAVARSARYPWTSRMAAEPSPTAAATRLMEPSRTSPTAKIPGRLVSRVRISGPGPGEPEAAAAARAAASPPPKSAAVEPSPVRT